MMHGQKKHHTIPTEFVSDSVVK